MSINVSHARMRMNAVTVLLILTAAAHSVADPVNSRFMYQGRLQQGGVAADGPHDFLFRLYDAEAGGTPVGGGLTAPGVDVLAGLFSVELDFGPGAFFGNARWLEIRVRATGSGVPYTTLAPRQPLNAAPYALYALNSPGGSGFWAANGEHIYNTNGGYVGIGTSEPAIDFHVHHPGASTGDVLIGSPAGWPGITGIANNGNRRDIRFSDSGMGFWTRNSPSAPVTGNGLFIAESGNVGVGTTFPATRFEIRGSNAIARINGQSSSFGPQIEFKNNPGIWGYYGTIQFMDGSEDVLAQIAYVDPLLADPSLAFGTVGGGMTIDDDGQVAIGPLGAELASSSLHVTGPANLSLTSGALWSDDLIVEDSDAVAGLYSTGAGTRGSTIVLAEVDAGGNLVDKWGIGRNTSGSDSALYVKYGTNPSYAANSTIMVLKSDGNAYFNGNLGIGTPTPAARLDINGTARVNVLQIMGADLAEKFPTSESETVEPGTVMEIDPHGQGQLRIARGAYNRRVAGVVSGAGDLPAGAVLGHLPGNEDAPPVALSGRVWVRCDARDQAIEVGDLLTTTDLPGHAMRAADHVRAQGAIIGKAMTGLDAGQGLVLVLVSLQ